MQERSTKTGTPSEIITLFAEPRTHTHTRTLQSKREKKKPDVICENQGNSVVKLRRCRCGNGTNQVIRNYFLLDKKKKSKKKKNKKDQDGGSL